MPVSRMMRQTAAAERRAVTDGREDTSQRGGPGFEPASVSHLRTAAYRCAYVAKVECIESARDISIIFHFTCRRLVTVLIEP